MLNDILFFASVLTFSAAAILGYWQLLRAEADGLDQPVVAAVSEPDILPDLVAEPVPVAV